MELSEPANPALHLALCHAKRVALLALAPELKVWLLCGHARDSSEPGVLRYLGDGTSLAYLRRLYFTDAEHEEVRPVAVARLRHEVLALARSRAPALVEVNRALAPLLPSIGFTSYPWLRQRVSLHGPRYQERAARLEATVGRRVHRQRFGFDLTQEADAVERFYTAFYCPYLQHRFGAACHVRSRRDLRSAARGGFLLRVRAEGRWLAGAICRRRGREVSLLGFGLAPPYEENLRHGALQAVYYFLFRWAESRGLASVDLLRSRPHVGDGVFEHKRRWGATAERDGWPHTLWRLLPPKRVTAGSTIGGHLVWWRGGFAPLASL